MMTIKTNKETNVLPILSFGLGLGLVATLMANFLLSNKLVDINFIIAASLITFNFAFALFCNKKAVAAKDPMFWGLAMKMPRLFIIVTALAIIIFLKLTSEPKSLAIIFLAGFFITLLFELLFLYKSFLSKQEQNVK